MYFVKSSHKLENYGFTKFLHAVHTMEKREIFSHQNFSSNQRFSNLSLVKPLLSRNFWQKFRENKSFTHCGFYEIFVSRLFEKISVKTMSLVKSLLYNWFHEIIFKWSNNLVNSTVCIVEITESYCHDFFAKIPSNQRFTY